MEILSVIAVPQVHKTFQGTTQRSVGKAEFSLIIPIDIV